MRTCAVAIEPDHHVSSFLGMPRDVSDYTTRAALCAPAENSSQWVVIK
jgi:hypothetical protein